MKPLHWSLILLGALSATVAGAQTMRPAAPTPPRAVQPPPPVPPVPPMPPMPPTPVAMPGFQQPMQPGHYMAPMGNQAWYLFETIRTNKAELKVSDAQWKTIQDARDADQKTRMDRSMQTMNTRRDLQTLADTDTPDIAKIEARVRDLKKAEGDDMMADFRLTALYRTTLTAAQREQLKTLAPKFEPMMPGGPGMMPGRPGIMPGGPGMMPGGPAMMPGGTPPAAPGSPGGQPMTPPNPKRP